ncbi:MAG: hypothetical protein GX902_07845 [Lentisphaerae bacterium]|nr:hypothetical protein [Lentisphaerota bacterium]
MMQHVLRCFAILLAASSVVFPLRSQEFSQLPNGLLQLENEFLRVQINPAWNGRVSSFYDKVRQLEYTDPAWDSGIMVDLHWQERFNSSKNIRDACTFEPLPGGVKLTRQPQGKESYQWLSLSKTYRLAAAAPSLQVSYELEVNPNAMQDISYCPWLHHDVRVKNRAGKMYIPTQSGIKEITYSSAKPLNESFHYDLQAGWSAYLLPEEQTGLLLDADYPDLMCLYNWQGSVGNTLEHLFRSQKIPCGKSFRAECSFTVFAGLSRIDGAAGGLCGELELSSQAVQGFRLYSASSLTGKYELYCRELPELLENKIAEGTVSLPGRTAVQIPSQHQLPAGKTCEIICRLTSAAGQQLLTLRALNQPVPPADYAVSPAETRRGNDQERFGQVIFDASDRQDCFKWDLSLPPNGGRPWLQKYSRGRIRLLVLTDVVCGREVTELANRMDAEVSTCTFSTNGWLKWHNIWGHAGGASETNIYLEELLKQDYDCIVLGGMQISVINQRNRQRLAEMVQNGTGLVAVMPYKIPADCQALFPATPMLEKSLHPPQGSLQPARTFVIAPTAAAYRALPLADLPVMLRFPYQSSQAQVTADEQPWYCQGEYGKGRTALFAWLTGRPDNFNSCGLAPFMPEEVPFPFQNYIYGSLIKSVLWACRRETTLLEELQIEDGTLVLSLNNQLSNAGELEIELSATHQSGLALESKKISLTLPAGRSRQHLPLDYPALQGRTWLEVRLRRQGYDCDFGGLAWQNDNPLKIIACDFPAQACFEDSVLPLSLQTSQKAQITVAITDQIGREIVRQDGTTAADGKLKLELPLRHLYVQYARITVEVRDQQGRLCDRQISGLDLVRKIDQQRSWDQFHLMLSWSYRIDRQMPFFHFPLRRAALNELGVTLGLFHGTPVGWGPEPQRWLLDNRYGEGSQLVMESLARVCGKDEKGRLYPRFDYRAGRQAEIKAIQQKYNDTRDKVHLHRNPQLDCPDYLARQKEALRQWLPELQQYHPFMYDLGDEMSYTYFSTPVDFDFSPESLQRFRNWLQPQYQSLQQLNQEWQRDFPDWSAVQPDTLLEARERGVYTGWAMHKLYNTTVFSGYLRMVADTIRECDPGALVTISGTQDPNPYNAYDWTQLMPIFDSMSAYTRDGLPEIYRSFKKIPTMGWVGYGSPADQMWEQIWNNVYNGHYGVALYNETVLLNPDLTLTADGLAIRDATKALREGIGTLIYNSEREKPSVAMHYSQASAIAAWIDNRQKTFPAVRGTWLELLKGLGCSVKFLSSREIEQGGLLQGGYRAVVLPLSGALSAAEVQALTAFVEQGGLLCADAQPGRYNERLVKLPGPALPAFPQAILLPEPLLSTGSSQELEQLRQRLRQHLLVSGAIPQQPEAAVTAGEADLHFFELCPAGGKIIALLARSAAEVSLTHKPGEYFYDCLSGQELQDLKVELQPSRPAVFCRLPYRVSGIEVKARRTDDGIALQAAVQPEHGAALRHVLRFVVSRPDGPVQRHYGKILEAPGGQAEHVFYPALNERGSWNIAVVDVLSGVRRDVTAEW